jgi:hypothetical protein
MVSKKANQQVHVTFTQELSVMYVYPWMDSIGDSITVKQSKPLPKFKKPQILYAFDPTIKVPKKIKNNYSLNKNFRQLLTGSSTEEKLTKLSQYSSVYTESIRTVLQSHKDGKCVFIYNELVEGSGLILFGLLLEFFSICLLQV